MDTLKVKLALDAPFVARMTALPAALAVTTPFWSTEATLVLELVHVAPFAPVQGIA